MAYQIQGDVFSSAYTLNNGRFWHLRSGIISYFVRFLLRRVILTFLLMFGLLSRCCGRRTLQLMTWVIGL
ncbi:hypothetical protein EYC84_008225 [Monilinia fructicola]|uniref:Uncharacterized protein n=1 Tax=Monilinia fructicola TaxID=38448 RepID=A0A5M9JDU2_MONFR|nr:hypothetical protein EYC84_008225 [Monilinia fructicola]